MYYQQESIKITQADNTSAYILTAQSLGIQQKIDRNINMRMGKFRPQGYLGTSRHPLTEVQVEYIPTGQLIEGVLGLKGITSAIDYLCNQSYGKKNFSMSIYSKDLSGETQNKTTINLESGALTSYTFSAGVQAAPKVSIQAQFTDLAIDNQQAVVYPIFDEKTPLPRNYDVSFNIPTGILGVKSCVPQSFSLQLPLNRDAVYQIGSAKPYSRNLTAPVIAQVSLNAIVEMDEAIGAGQFNSVEMQGINKGDWLDDIITAQVYKPISQSDTPETLITFRINKPYVDSVNWSASVGQNRNVQITLSVPVSFENGDELQNLKIY